MDHNKLKIEQIKSFDPNGANVSAQHGVCRFEPGEDAMVRRAKEEKVAESLQARHGHGNIDGYVPAQPVDHDGEYIVTRREEALELYCIAWRDGGLWRRLSDWSEQVPESATQHTKILFAPEIGLLRPVQPR